MGALKSFRSGVVAATLKQKREEQKQETATGQSKDAKEDSAGATSSATGQLGASVLLEGGASSSGGPQIKLDEFSKDKNDASKAQHDRKSGTQATGSGGAGTGKGKPRNARSRGRSQGGGRQQKPARSPQSDDTESPSLISEGGRSSGVSLRPGPGGRRRSRSAPSVKDKDV